MARLHKFSNDTSKAALAACVLLSLGAPAQAAEDAQLLKLRDSAHPALCDLKPGDPPYTGIKRFVLAGTPRTTLYVVPCRASAFDVYDVLFIGDGGRLRPLYFARPGFELPTNGHGAGAWAKARMTRIGVTAMLSAPEVNKGKGTITTGSRIAPGLGQGELSLTYRIEQGSVVLVRFAALLDGKKPIIIWRSPSRG